MSYVTRVSIWFSSEGASPAIIIKKLLEMGFTLVRGAYDFVYYHDSTREMSGADLTTAILETANALHETLSGFNVHYTLATHPADEVGDFVPLDVIDEELKKIEEELQEIEKEETVS